MFQQYSAFACHLLIQSPFGGFRFIVGSGGGIDGEIAIRTLCSAQGYFVTGHLKFVSGKKIDAARVSIHTVRQDDIC